jgi:hypothetical protein
MGITDGPPFRQGMVWDAMSDGLWHRREEVAAKSGCTVMAINKAIDRMMRLNLIEHNGAPYRFREIRLVRGAPRPLDKRGYKGPKVRPEGWTPNEAPTYDFAPPLLAQLWRYPTSRTNDDICASLDTRVPEVCPQNTQAAD